MKKSLALVIIILFVGFVVCNASVATAAKKGTPSSTSSAFQIGKLVIEKNGDLVIKDSQSREQVRVTRDGYPKCLKEAFRKLSGAPVEFRVTKKGESGEFYFLNVEDQRILDYYEFQCEGE